MSYLVHDLITDRAAITPEAGALSYQGACLSYAALAEAVAGAATGFIECGLERGGRVAVFLEKRTEAVVAMFGATAAAGVFVPINPLLKPEQVAFIVDDCEAEILVTSPERLRALVPALAHCPALHTVVVTGATGVDDAPVPPGVRIVPWQAAFASPAATPTCPAIDADMAAILYTSGSTGKPKGVVLSHRNLLAGAASVVRYLGNLPSDRILAALPLSFDYGLSQLTTAFHVGATAVLLNYLTPRDIVHAVESERITGLAGVPALWIQLARLPWPHNSKLRYFTNSGGAMPRATLAALQKLLPSAEPFLMYGLTEAFRSTFLPPGQVEARPDSIGKAIPNAEILVLRPDGTECAPGESGELVHRGALVAMGYWKDPQRTAERFRPLPADRHGRATPEIAVWSGDIVRTDAEGFLYYIGRNDDMIKTSGYRVSPTEVEEVVYDVEEVAEAAAIGVPHAELGQGVGLVIVPVDAADLNEDALLAACRRRLPGYMVPAAIVQCAYVLPRNPNGKIDRKRLAEQFRHTFSEGSNET
ncbi:MAG: acyl-CoA ligase (AMP-forming), exosortase A system-associated [Burkholderiaceae bacterium]